MSSKLFATLCSHMQRVSAPLSPGPCCKLSDRNAAGSSGGTHLPKMWHWCAMRDFATPYPMPEDTPVTTTTLSMFTMTPKLGPASSSYLERCHPASSQPSCSCAPAMHVPAVTATPLLSSFWAMWPKTGESVQGLVRGSGKVTISWPSSAPPRQQSTATMEHMYGGGRLSQSCSKAVARRVRDTCCVIGVPQEHA